MDQNSGGFQQFIKTDPDRVYQILFVENQLINNTNAYVEPKIGPAQHLTVNDKAFPKFMLS